jgi:hypothetical protein
MSESNKSDITSYCGVADSFKPTSTVGNAGVTGPSVDVPLLGAKKSAVVDCPGCPVAMVTSGDVVTDVSSGVVSLNGSGDW